MVVNIEYSVVAQMRNFGAHFVALNYRRIYGFAPSPYICTNRTPFLHLSATKKTVIMDGRNQGNAEHYLNIWKHETTTDPDIPPALITKKWLAVRFGFMQPSGFIYYKGLYSKVLTPEVIAAMGCKVEEIRNARLKTFTRQQTLQLIEILGL